MQPVTVRRKRAPARPSSTHTTTTTPDAKDDTTEPHHHMWVSRSTNRIVLTKRALHVLDMPQCKRVTLHGLGAAIMNTIHAALQIVEQAGGTDMLTIHTNTDTVPLTDEIIVLNTAISTNNRPQRITTTTTLEQQASANSSEPAVSQPQSASLVRGAAAESAGRTSSGSDMAAGAARRKKMGAFNTTQVRFNSAVHIHLIKTSLFESAAELLSTQTGSSSGVAAGVGQVASSSPSNANVNVRRSRPRDGGQSRYNSRSRGGASKGGKHTVGARRGSFSRGQRHSSSSKRARTS